MSCHAVILAGGRGERFWPLSRAHLPKQLIPLLGDLTLLEATAQRVEGKVPPERTWMVAGGDLRGRVEQLCPQLLPDHFVWEPVGRNTAAAVGAAAERILLEGEEAELLVLPSDHWVPSPEAFWDTVEAGLAILPPYNAVVFGIPPLHPETGFGYVERGEVIDPARRAFEVQRFHEKPDLMQAEQYIRLGSYYWNSGVFLFSAARVAENLRSHIPEMAQALDRLRAALRAGGGGDPWTRYFQDCPSISLDHGLMESLAGVAVVEARFAWSDLGAWTAWGDHQAADGAGNRVCGEALLRDASNCILYSEHGGLLAAIGVRDLIVVRVGDAALVCHKDRAQEVRQLVREGKADERLRRFF